MCISSKGPGYDPVAVVKEAIAKLNVTAEGFFTAAKEHTKSSFEPKAAAAQYEANRQGFVIPAQVVAFADWCSMKEPRYVKEKYKILAGSAAPAGKPAEVLGLEGEVAVGLA